MTCTVALLPSSSEAPVTLIVEHAVLATKRTHAKNTVSTVDLVPPPSRGQGQTRRLAEYWVGLMDSRDLFTDMNGPRGVTQAPVKSCRRVCWLMDEVLRMGMNHDIGKRQQTGSEPRRVAHGTVGAEENVPINCIVTITNGEGQWQPHWQLACRLYYPYSPYGDGREVLTHKPSQGLR